MSNGWIFSLQTALIGGCLLFALRLGKEALSAFLALLVVLMNLFVTKQIDLFTLSVTASDSITVGYLLGLNLFQESFGRSETKKCIFLSFFIASVFCLLSFVHLIYTPNAFDYTHESFKVLLLPGFRIFSASLFTFFIVQFFDLRLFAFFRRKTEGKYLPLRIALSLILSELIDTALFTTLGLLGSVHSPLQVALLSFLIKLGSILLFIPFSMIAKKMIRHAIPV